MDEPHKIIDPTRTKTKGAQAGDQLSAFISEAILNGIAGSLGKALQERTMGDGPWLLYADGTVTAYEEKP